MLNISPIPAFDDNYIWLLRQEGQDLATVVDPGDEEPVIARLAAEGLALGAILLTHHHGDHIGGVADLLARWPQARVYGPRDRRIRLVTDPVGEGDLISPPGLGTSFQVLEVPGHTATHIAYLAEPPGAAKDAVAGAAADGSSAVTRDSSPRSIGYGGRSDPGDDARVPGMGTGGALFCGDTLFAAGCGRVFDGTFDQLAASLARIAALPPDTRIYCAHEYTLANLGFADWVEPDSPALAARRARVAALLAAGQPTVPSRLAEELATNPFLRTAVPGVQAAAEVFAGVPLTTAAQVFTALRQWKDSRYD